MSKYEDASGGRLVAARFGRFRRRTFAVRAASAAMVGLLFAPGGIVNAAPPASQADGAVFILTNSTDPSRGNEIGMYVRDGKTGDLELSGFFPTGRLDQGAPQLGAGPAPTSSVFGFLLPVPADSHGSSDSLILGLRNRCLFAVNAGSNSVSSFRVMRGDLELMSVISSKGSADASFPNSLAEYKGVLYVLNAGGMGSLTGFDVGPDCSLEPIPESTRSLAGISDSFPIPAPVEVLTSPAHIAFSPDGNRLVAAIKGGDVPARPGLFPSGRVAVFSVDADGLLGEPQVTPFSSPELRGGPFSVLFTGPDELIVTHSNSQTVGTYRILDDGSLSIISGPFSTSSTAPCWLDATDQFAYIASLGDLPAVGASPNANGTIDIYRVLDDGALEPLGIRVDYPVPGPGISGNHGIDIRIIGQYLYIMQPRFGRVGRYTIADDGNLTDFADFGGFAPGVEPFAGFNPGIETFLTRCFLQDPEDASPECAQGAIQGIAGF